MNNGAKNPMRSHPRRRASDKPPQPPLKRRVVFLLALIAGLILAGLAGVQEADAVTVHASSVDAVQSAHVVTLVLLIVLFFLTAGLVGVFWYHLAASQGEQKR